MKKATLIAFVAALAICCSFNVGCTGGSSETVVSPTATPPKEPEAEKKNTGSMQMDEDDYTQ